MLALALSRIQETTEPKTLDTLRIKGVMKETPTAAFIFFVLFRSLDTSGDVAMG
jgi:hypothetical protein